MRAARGSVFRRRGDFGKEQSELELRIYLTVASASVRPSVRPRPSVRLVALFVAAFVGVGIVDASNGVRASSGGQLPDADADAVKIPLVRPPVRWPRRKSCVVRCAYVTQFCIDFYN